MLQLSAWRILTVFDWRLHVRPSLHGRRLPPHDHASTEALNFLSDSPFSISIMPNARADTLIYRTRS